MSHPGVERVVTARMILDRLRSEHAEALPQLLRDPRVARTLSAGGSAPTDAEIRHALATKQAHWEHLGFGLWLARDRKTGGLIGEGGLQSSLFARTHEVEVAWAIVPDRWGQGLATELARAAIDVAFGELALPEIVAFTLADNVASRRVADKCGFRLEREIVHCGLPHLLYRLPAPARDGGAP